MSELPEKQSWQQRSPVLRFLRLCKSEGLVAAIRQDYATLKDRYRRLVHWLFCWRTLRRILLSLVSLITLLALFYAEENWRGFRAWHKYKTAAEADGEQFSFKAFIPAPVPDRENFAMIPLFTPTFDYEIDPATTRFIWKDASNAFKIVMSAIGPPLPRPPAYPDWGRYQNGEKTDLEPWQKYYRAQAAVAADSTNEQIRHDAFPIPTTPQSPAEDVLVALTKYEENYRQIKAASQRPYCRFPIHYEEGYFALAHLAKLKPMSQYLVLRAIAELHLDRNQQALEDVMLAFYLADSMRQEPLLVSHMVRVVVLSIVLRPVWEGLAAHRWTEPQLLELQQRLQQIDLLAEYENAVRAERASELLWVEKAAESRLAFVGIQFLLEGDVYFNMQVDNLSKEQYRWCVFLSPRGWFHLNQLFRARLYDQCLSCVDSTLHRVYPNRVQKAAEEWELPLPFRPDTFLGRSYLNPSPLSRQVAETQTFLHLATVACALERHRLVSGGCPKALEGLVPRFLNILPPDLLTGRPLHYRLLPNQKFILYSVGWDGFDNQGQPQESNDSTGDWVWRFP